MYVISPAQRIATGNEIVLRQTPGGFGTALLPGGVIRVEGTRLVIERDGAVRGAEITSLREMASFAGIEPDVAQQEQFDVPPPGDLDAPLPVEGAAAAQLAGWYAFAAGLLEDLSATGGAQDAVTPVNLWPEHFDVAIDMGDEAAGCRATYGASPGDRHHPQPYLYASPWAGRIDPFFDDPGFRGAALLYEQIGDRAAAEAFLRAARERVTQAPGR